MDAKNAETNLRKAGNAFGEAIKAAEGAGLHLVWPSNATRLSALQISAGAKAAAATAPTSSPAPAAAAPAAAAPAAAAPAKGK